MIIIQTSVQNSDTTPNYDALKSKLANEVCHQYSLHGVALNNIFEGVKLNFTMEGEKWSMKPSFRCKICHNWLALSYSKNKNGSFSQFKYGNLNRHHKTCKTKNRENDPADSSEDSSNGSSEDSTTTSSSSTSRSRTPLDESNTLLESQLGDFH